MEPADFQRYRMPLNRLDPPSPGTVHLWFLDLGQLGNPLQPDAAPSARLFRPRQLRTLRRFYLRLLLGAYLGVPGKKIRISRLIKGKPVLAGPAKRRPLDFSMASSDGCCLIGVSSSGLIGIDLELEGRRVGDPVRLARRYFSAGEASALAALDRAEADPVFMHMWACKEAVVKGAGHGLANQLGRFTVLIGPDGAPEMVSMEGDEASAWRLALVRPSERHVGAVALRDRELQLKAFRLLPPPGR